MVRVTLLGEQVVSDGAGTVRLRSSRTVALLAFLALHAGAPQNRQRIAATFWPDSSDEQALTNLRRELHHLRGVLGPDPSLVVTARDLCWNDSPTCSVDVREFQAHRAAAVAGDAATLLGRGGAAVARYGGEFLPGSYDDWALEARNALEQQCVDLLDRLVPARMGAGDASGAVDAARRRIQLRPVEEAGYRTLMELQGDLGDRAGAVRTYHLCASVLERELGVEPDPRTRATLNGLLARTGPAVEMPAPEPAGRSASRVVGRDAELRLLQGLWSGVATGGPRLVIVRGDPGVGKTRLMTELADRSGAVVADARCFGTAGRLALAPVADWLRTPAIRSALENLEPVWRAEVERLVPTSRGRSEPAPGPRAMVDSWQRHRFFEGLARALLQVGRPVLLTLDNLHWCDPETLAFVTFCLALTPDAPLMVVATLRDDPDEQEPGLPSWIVRMRATGRLTEVQLGPLDEIAAVAVAQDIVGRPIDDVETATMLATTGGYPLYIVELARWGRGPRGTRDLGDLSRVLAERLGQVSAEARDVAGLAAAVGRDFTLDLLAEAADLDADTVVRAVDELWRRRILREGGDGYDFSHDLLREAAYAEVGRPRRWLLHRRIAQGLELLHADDVAAVSAQLADQYARAGQATRAIDYYRQAAEIATCRFGHAEAVRLLDAALELVRSLPEGRGRRVRELAVLQDVAAPLNAQFGYASPRVQETMLAAIAAAEEVGDRDALLNSLVGLQTTQFVHGDIGAAHATATRALSLVEPGSALVGPAHFAAGGSGLSLGKPEEALSHLLLAAEYSGGAELSVGTRTDVHGRAWAAHAHWLLGHDADALACAEDAVARARSIGGSYPLAVALAYAAVTHQLRHDLPRLSDATAELLALCERYGFAYYREWGLILDGWQRTDGSGAALIADGIANLTHAEALSRMPYWLSLSADLAGREGRVPAAVATLDAALASGRARDDVWWLPEVLRMRAAHDEPRAAATRLEAAKALAEAHGSVTLAARCADDLAAFGVPPLP